MKNVMKRQKNRFSLLIVVCFMLFVPASVYAVDFAFTDLDGNESKLSQYQGKWVLVNFWATWCPPCRKEIPELSDFHLENEDAVVIGVNYEPELNDERLKKFIAVYLISYPVTRVSDEIITALGQPQGLPTSVLISPEGAIVKTIAGIVTDKTLNKFIAQYEKTHN